MNLTSQINSVVVKIVKLVRRAYGLGSQCRLNECLFWVWETPGGRDLG